jgi:hypothetical protein
MGDIDNVGVGRQVTDVTQNKKQGENEKHPKPGG